MGTKFIFLTTIFLLSSCKKNNEGIQKDKKTNNEKEKIVSNDDPYQRGYNDKVYLNKLLEDALLKGDTIAYRRAFKEFTISGHNEEFIYYAIKMAERHDVALAYADAYYLLTYRQDEPNKIAIFYLLKAYEKGDKDAKSEVKEIFLDKKIPSSNSFMCNK